MDKLVDNAAYLNIGRDYIVTKGWLGECSFPETHTDPKVSKFIT